MRDENNCLTAHNWRLAMFLTTLSILKNKQQNKTGFQNCVEGDPRCHLRWSQKITCVLEKVLELMAASAVRFQSL
jgi:hypothetical protein